MLSYICIRCNTTQRFQHLSGSSLPSYILWVLVIVHDLVRQGTIMSGAGAGPSAAAGECYRKISLGDKEYVVRHSLGGYRTRGGVSR